jgi:hypothetical protein
MMSVEGTFCGKKRRKENGNMNKSYGTVKLKESGTGRGNGSVKGGNVNEKENIFVYAGRRRGSGIGSMWLFQGGSALLQEDLLNDYNLLLLDPRSLCGVFHLDVVLCIGGPPCFLVAFGCNKLLLHLQ